MRASPDAFMWLTVHLAERPPGSPGVLRLTIPVAEKAKPRKVKITNSTDKKKLNA